MKIKASLAALLLLTSMVSVNPAMALGTKIYVSQVSHENRYIVEGRNGSLKYLLGEFRNSERLFGDYALIQAKSEKIVESLRNSGMSFGHVTLTPDGRKHRLDVPNDTYWSDLWAMDTDSRYGIDLLAAHDLFTTKNPGEDAVVAVVDTGYTNHPDLSNSYIGGYDFIEDYAPTAYCGVSNSNDGNGRDADPADSGDWYGGWSSSWHGTHVHGTIAATKNNSRGVVGVAPFAKVLHARVLGSCGGYDSEIALAIRWAAGLSVTGIPTNTQPADVINMSLGGEGACSSFFQSAITAARNAGTVVVVAAGNDNASMSNFSPANCNDVITVAATGPQGYRSYYSNFGSGVDLAAPGGDFSGGYAGGILSTLNTGSTTPGLPTYAFYQGTSMATPHVAGVVALIRSVNPDLTSAEVETLLLSAVNTFRSDATANGCSKAGKCGTGLLDAQKAVAAAVNTLPDGEDPVPNDTDVQELSVTIGNRSATLNWTLPLVTTNLTGFRVTLQNSRATCINTASQLSCSLSQLRNGTLYIANVEARYGSSYAPPVQIEFTPYPPPSAPQLRQVGLGTASLTPLWRAARLNSPFPILEYRAEAVTSSGVVAGFCTTVSLTCTINGLVTGEPYKIRLTVRNAVGSASNTSRSTYRPR